MPDCHMETASESAARMSGSESPPKWALYLPSRNFQG